MAESSEDRGTDHLDALAEYEPDPAELRLRVSGLQTADCIRRVESCVERQKGVMDAALSYPAALLWLRYDRNKTDLAPVLEALEQRGYPATLVDDASEAQPQHGPPCDCRYAWLFVASMIVFQLGAFFFDLSLLRIRAGEQALFLAALVAANGGLFRRVLRDIQWGFWGGEILIATGLMLCLLGPMLAPLAIGPYHFGLIGVVALALYLGYQRRLHRLLASPVDGTPDALEGIQADEALASKPPIQRSADQIAGLFPPLVLLTAVGALLLWGLLPELLGSFSEGWRQYVFAPTTNGASSWLMGLYCAVAIVFCAAPWAIVLAAPSSLRAGLHFAIQRGIVIKESRYLQHLRDLTNIVFERRGALTVDAPRVADVFVVPGVAEERLLYWVASAETLLTRDDIADAVQAFARSKEVELGMAASGRLIPGQGIVAEVDGEIIRVGRPAFLDAEGVDIRSLEHTFYRWGKEGKSPLVVARGKKLLGCLALHDALRPDSVRVIKILRRMGVWPVLLTGEAAQTAKTIGEQVGITEAVGDLDAKTKGEIVRRLKKDTIGTVAYAGADPAEPMAWERADLLLGLGAQGASHIDIRSGALDDLLLVIQLGRATYHNIIQNAFIAAIYNALIVPVAMVGLLHPILGLTAGILVVMWILRNGAKMERFDSEKFTREQLRR